MACFAVPCGLRYAGHYFNRAHAQQSGPAVIPADGKLGASSLLPQPRCAIDQAGRHQGSGRLQAPAKPSLAVDNTLDRQFDVAAPDRAWVTDITYIRTLESFAYLAVVIDLYSRRVVGWSMQSRQTTDAVLQALHIAVWRRKPRQRGSQCTSMDWAAFIGLTILSIR